MVTVQQIIIYQNSNGSEPFSLWLNALDRQIRTRIKARLNRLECSNLGDWQRVGGGIFEIRMHFGAGYRIYFSLHNNKAILLLCGGDKGSQENDIMLAQKYLNDFKKR